VVSLLTSFDSFLGFFQTNNMKLTVVLVCLCGALLASCAAAASSQRQLLQADDMMTITGAANENGYLVATRYMALDDLTGLAPTQLGYLDDGQHESGTLLPGAYGGYGLTGGAYGGLLESGAIASSSMVESLPEVEVKPSIPVAEQSSKPLTLNVQGASSDAAATATASSKSAAGTNSMAAQVVLMAMAVAAAVALMY
jgi:hypothetical protein